MSSGLLLLFGAGAVIGPLLVAPLQQWLGPGALFGAALAVHLLLGAFTAWRMRRRAPAPVEEHVTFGEAAQAALTLSTAFQHDEPAATPTGGTAPRRQLGEPAHGPH